MPAWPDIAVAVAVTAILAAAPAAAVDGDRPDLLPARQATIIAGAKACLGSTVDAGGQAARLTGWTPATPEQRKAMNSDGSVVTRDNVMLAYKPGKDGGCVVMAQADGAFDAATFYPQLGALVGATVVANDNPAPITLPNGEILIPVIAPKTATAGPTVILVFANAAGKYSKKEN